MGWVNIDFSSVICSENGCRPTIVTHMPIIKPHLRISLPCDRSQPRPKYLISRKDYPEQLSCGVIFFYPSSFRKTVSVDIRKCGKHSIIWRYFNIFQSSYQTQPDYQKSTKNDLQQLSFDWKTLRVKMMFCSYGLKRVTSHSGDVSIVCSWSCW